MIDRPFFLDAQDVVQARIQKRYKAPYVSKPGNRYIQTLLIHGARAVLRHIGDKTDPLSVWLKALVERRGMNMAAILISVWVTKK